MARKPFDPKEARDRAYREAASLILTDPVGARARLIAAETYQQMLLDAKQPNTIARLKILSNMVEVHVAEKQAREAQVAKANADMDEILAALADE